MKRPLLLIALLALLAAACAADDTDATFAPDPGVTAPPTTLQPAPTFVPDSEPCARAGEYATECEVPGYPDRPYDIAVPSTYFPDDAAPVVVVLHGGGGNSDNAATGPCRNGDESDPSCFHLIGEFEGFLTVYPNGSAAPLAPNIRTWNAGGGADGYSCASGRACDENVDDIAYLTALLDELEATMGIDPSRIFFTGLSNGGAMAHRVACEMADRVAAIAAVGGANQFATSAECTPSEPVSVMQVHGTEDPCWTYEESSQACLDDTGELKAGVEDSTLGWVERLGCAPESAEAQVADAVADGTTTTQIRWSGCDGGAEVWLLRIDGGGHAWPGGHQYFAEATIGIAPQDWDVGLIWTFFNGVQR